MKFRIAVIFLLTVGIVVAFSLISTRLWYDKAEPSKGANRPQVTLSDSMTVREAADAYGLSPRALKGALKLSSPADLDKTIADLGMTAPEADQRIKKAKAFAAEESSKNWVKIPLKFALWIVFLAIAFGLMRRGAVSPRIRKIMLALSVGVFGVVLGSDPSPMGTVKDAIVLWGKEQIVFPPRLVALTVFLLMVIIANKFICSWGCQFGVLQDLVFRINRNSTDTAAVTKQWKPPFFLTNLVRVIFFAAICVFAIGWATDIVAPIDPFGIFRPAKLGAIGAGFAGLILIGSLFVYRPWCHMFCPFGLIGWVFEKLSVHKIRVNYDTCVACEACARSCPSTVMGAILKQDRAVPDCFSCGTCQGVCPTKSITFDRGARKKPPADKFGCLG